jgi:hypothetical protein
MSKGVELNEKIKKAIREMLIELRENIYAVLESSYDIQKIFVPIVQHLIDESSYKFNFEEIHREEFARAVSKDEFLKIIFLQIKSNSKNPSYEELFEILTEIEDLLSVTDREMTRFKGFIELALEKINLINNGTLPNCECNHNLSHNYLSKKYCNHNSNKNNQNGQNVQNCQNGVRNKSLTGQNNLSKKDKFKDIDDLLDYINKDDEEEEQKPKKNKKKNNKGKEKKLVSSSNVLTNLVVDKEKLEKEIEEFKLNIKDNSINAFSIRKIKPHISRDWLSGLVKEVQSI